MDSLTIRQRSQLSKDSLAATKSQGCSLQMKRPRLLLDIVLVETV